jgi:hypothetical protein
MFHFVPSRKPLALQISPRLLGDLKPSSSPSESLPLLFYSILSPSPHPYPTTHAHPNTPPPSVNYYTHHLVYHAAIRNLLHGMESLVQAPANVTIHAIWNASIARRRRVAVAGNVIEEGDGELCLVLTETSVIRCGRHLAWYIRGSLERNHNEMHDGFRRKWEEVMGLVKTGEAERTG